MLRIRLRRIGRKNQPFFQIVVIERGAAPKGGRANEMLGSYDPLTKQRIIKKERIKYWLSVGAEPSDTVHNMLVSEGVIEGEKKRVHAKSKKKEEAPEKVAAPVAPVAEAPPAEVETPGEEEKPEVAPEAEEAPEEKKPEPAPEVKEEPKAEKLEEKPTEEKIDEEKPEKKPEIKEEKKE